MKYNLEVTNLEKNYSDFKLDNINIKLPEGKIIGVIGENGSGKTTTIKTILNLIKPDKGEIKIFNKPNDKLNKEEREKIGLVLDDSFFSPILNIDDINKIMKRFYHTWNEDLYYNYVKEFKLPRKRPLKEFSSGMKMKIKVICAIAHKSELLILDEPTNGLDPIFRYEIIDLFAKFVSNNKNSILMTTHITSDLEHLADELIFINEGKVILNVSKNTIDEKYGLIEAKEEIYSKISKEDYHKSLKYKNEYLILVNDQEQFIKKYPEIVLRHPTLEEILLLLVKGV